MKKTLIAMTAALLLTGAANASAQSAYGYYDRDDGDYSEEYRDRYADTRDDLDRDGVYDPYDRYDDRRGTSWDEDRDGMNDRYELDDRNGYDDRNAYNDRDRDGVANRYDRYDNRYDGRHDNRRNYARHRYQAGRYYAPRNYRYLRYNVGSRLPTGYYGSNHYIDSRPYGLALPPRGYRWNRVGSDAYLVSVTNGLVRDVMYSLFY